MNHTCYYFSILHLLKVRCFEKFGSQKVLADRLGIDPANLSKIFSGVIKPKATLFLSICSELDYTLTLSSTTNPFEI